MPPICSGSSSPCLLLCTLVAVNSYVLLPCPLHSRTIENFRNGHDTHAHAASSQIYDQWQRHISTCDIPLLLLFTSPCVRLCWCVCVCVHVYYCCVFLFSQSTRLFSAIVTDTPPAYRLTKKRWQFHAAPRIDGPFMRFAVFTYFSFFSCDTRSWSGDGYMGFLYKLVLKCLQMDLA